MKTCLLFLILSVTAIAEELPKSIQIYRKLYELTLKKAKQEYVKDLKAAQKKAARYKKFKEVVAIQAEIDKFECVPVKLEIPKRPITIKYSNGGTRRYRFDGSKVVKYTTHPIDIELSGNVMILHIRQRKQREEWTLVEGKWNVKHWGNGHKTPNCTGVQSR